MALIPKKEPVSKLHRTVLSVIVIMFSMCLTSSAAIYYVNCSASGGGSGTSSSPWNSLSTVNAHTFAAGDQLLFLRGTTCYGNLAPLGSGSSGTPIVIQATGTGPQPIISGTSDSVLSLSNQQYWEINNLEIVGGQHYGVHVTQSLPNTTTNHVYLTNLNVHGAAFASQRRTDSGEVVIDSTGGIWNDLVLNGIFAHDTVTSEGIYIQAGGAYVYPETSQPLGTNITVENSTVRRVGEDGILVIEGQDVVIQNSVVAAPGNCARCTDKGVGLWVYQCTSCTIQGNESYALSPYGITAGDAGAFDIDYHTHSVVLQYNYGHDAAGYCFSIFGSSNDASTNNIARYNVCANNEQEQTSVKPNQGDVFLSTWNGGTLDGVQIYNNTFYWNPSGDTGVLDDNATFTGSSPNFFKNNLIYAKNSTLLSQKTSLTLANNLYFTTSSSGPKWYWNGTAYTTLAAFQAASGQDANSLYANPMLNAISDAPGMPTRAYLLKTGSPALSAGALIASNGGRDFYGNSVSSTVAPNIGAYNGAGADPSNLIANQGFEAGSLSPWSPWNSASISSANVFDGHYAASLIGISSVEQAVGVNANTTYTFGGWAKSAAPSDTVNIGVKNYGGSGVFVPLTGSAYAFGSVQFSTGGNSTSATTYAYHPATSGTGYADDVSLVQDIVANPGFETGSATPWIEYNATIVTSPVHSGNAAMQVTNGGSAEQAVTGLDPATTYVLQSFGAQQAGTSGSIVLGVKDYGNSQVLASVPSSSFSPVAVNFTTGTSSTTATIFLYDNSGTSKGTADDFVVVPEGIANPDVELGVPGAWGCVGTSAVDDGQPHAGSYDLMVTGSGSGCEQVIENLRPNSSYIFGAWAKVDTLGNTSSIGVKNYGGSQVDSSVTATGYTWTTVTFTTGPTNTSASVFLYKGSGSGAVYGDDFTFAPAVE